MDLKKESNSWDAVLYSALWMPAAKLPLLAPFKKNISCINGRHQQ